jgi:hypothetical protein
MSISKPFTAWNSSCGIEGLPARFETLKLAQSFESSGGGANTVTHDDGREWCSWGSGDSDNFTSGWMQVEPSNPEDGPKCHTCNAHAKQAMLFYTPTAGKAVNNRVIEYAETRHYCAEHLNRETHSVHMQNHMPFGRQFDCAYCSP